MKNLAINICILPSEEVSNFCHDIYNEDTSNYSSEELPFIPHITLYQKALSEESIEFLKDNIGKLDLDTFEIELWECFFSTLLWVTVKRNYNLNQLQKKIIDTVSDLKGWELTKESFLTQKYFFEENILWVEWYSKYLDFKKDLHITLWKDDQSQLITNSPDNFTFDTLAIWLMWNYLSVREILFKIKIK